MILGLHHISIICSSLKSVEFYEKLGFKVTSRNDRGYDVLFMMEGFGVRIKVFVDSTHPARLDKPEAIGLRYLTFFVDDVEKTIKELKLDVGPIRESDNKKHFAFLRDPDGLPIELHEY